MADKMQQYQKQLQEAATKFDHDAIKRFPQLQKAQDAGARPVFIAAGAGALVSLITMGIFGALNTLNAIATLVPAGLCFAALHDGSAAQTHVQWMSYWCLFATLTLCDGLYDVAPFVYFLAKACACTYLGAFHGAQFVFEKAITPAGNAIKKALGAATKKAQDAGKTGVSGKQPIHQSVDDQKEVERAAGKVGT